MRLPSDYRERVYAGVLGKIIGVYLGRPVENWSHAAIENRFGFVDRFVNEDLGLPLIVPDDDITGTLTFVRALADHGNDPNLSAASVGETWLDYIIENRSILWWGGFGNSSEHTAFLRLKSGTPAPASGSRAINGSVVSEQIGAQIFIDGFALVAPGRPALAARLAGVAGSVAHDGEAVLAAQALAVMESLAFTSQHLGNLLEAAERILPSDSTIARVHRRARELRAQEPDWRVALAALEADFGGSAYPGLVHVVPNHALILLGLLYGEGDFRRSLAICTSAGRDTDCNAGNLGCVLGVFLGPEGLPADWRTAVRDRLYLPTADGGRGLSDALLESERLVETGLSLAGLPIPRRSKGGARFHFGLPGSVQGFALTPDSAPGDLANVASGDGLRALRLTPERAGEWLVVATPAFLPAEMLHHRGYGLNASPIAHSGQVLLATVNADATNPAPLRVRLGLRVHGGDTDERGEEVALVPGEACTLQLRIPDTRGQPVSELRVAATGTLYLHALSIEGQAEVSLTRPEGGQDDLAWQMAFTSSVTHFEARFPKSFHLSQDHGTGLLTQGNDTWRDYQVSATITPILAEGYGLVARHLHERQYYALELTDGGQARLVKAGPGPLRAVVAQTPYPQALNTPVLMSLTVRGDTISGRVNSTDLSFTDLFPFSSGAAGFTLTYGTITSDRLNVKAIRQD